ncbi:hypothetical protein HPC37_04570 [Pasteurellaceae bacterium 20609_3]|uniref:hypothetical protein n=1 Tax=Spirabiliibacterium mucosae TaxID=28156 RepID=UPI001AACACD9|nr:hypothetical protein [Spirabiliibacterium mucosae]MBE2898115.1 hypothetical protein [Spirabiliibacterium mucosae]
MIIFSREEAGFSFEIHKQRAHRFGVVKRLGKEAKRTTMLANNDQVRAWLNRLIAGHNRHNPNNWIKSITKKEVAAQTDTGPKVIAKLNPPTPMKDFRPLQRRTATNPLIHQLEKELRCLD